ncbi:COX15/CtaA family protein [soil metagenome]
MNESPARSRSLKWVHRWAILTACVTFVLLCIGGLVTSHEAGMSVPDWPNTYGYNMFLFPISRWVGGIFYEHLHRLIASGVGLLTAVLACWLWVRETKGSVRWQGVIGFVVVLALLGVRKMPMFWALASLSIPAMAYGFYRFSQDPKSFRWLGLVAFAAVILQGILGGLRVVEHADEIGIFHTMLAQTFFTGLVLLCVATSRSFQEKKWADYEPNPTLKWWAFGATALIFFQLGVGATMRHEHIGLSIPDFPLAYGQVLPDTSAAALEKINETRKISDLKPTSAAQIWLQMAHRGMALLIFCAVVAAFLKSRQSAKSIRLWMTVWLCMLFVQICLGAWTIWSGKAADVATMHMALGALSLLVGVVNTFRLFRGARTQDFVLPDAPNPRWMADVA